jgi:site-specific recombinase XerD
MIAASFQSLLQSFFLDRLLHQRQASPHTIAGYRDTFRLLLQFADERLGHAPANLKTEHLDAPFIGAFLDHIETERGNSARTRNARLSAIHSFFRYVALTEPAHALLCQRILAMPSKRQQRKPIAFLDRAEIDALLAAPDPASWTGRRDRTLLTVALQTGLRVSEIIGLCCQDVVLGTGAHVRCEGKGRKHRSTPLRPEVARQLDEWIRARHGQPADPVFPSTRRGALSRDAVERIVTRHVATAVQTCPSLQRKKVTPHVLRHTAAMELLQAGVDRSVIALWLGHESMETTQMYLHASLDLKEQAIARTTPFGTEPGRYHPDDQLLAFLEAL